MFERLTRRPYSPGEDRVPDGVYDAVTTIAKWISLDVAAGRSSIETGLGQLTIGPTFAESPFVGGADADFMADGVLWDVKAGDR